VQCGVCCSRPLKKLAKKNWPKKNWRKKIGEKKLATKKIGEKNFGDGQNFPNAFIANKVVKKRCRKCCEKDL
jgi:hypothetical protein